MHIIVCMKVTPKPEQVKLDPVTKTIIREGVENEINPADKNALEAALQLKEKHNCKVTVIGMGPPIWESFMKLAVAMGADDAVLISDKAFAGADTLATSRTLAEAIKKIGEYHIILCGEESSDAGTGHVPPSIAEFLNIPQITFVSNVEIVDGKIRAKRVLEGAYEIIECEPPVLLSIEYGSNTPRFPDFRRKRWVDKEFKLKILNIKDLELREEEVGLKGSRSIVEELREMSLKERARQKISGTEEEIASQILEIIRPYIKK
ncbi:MAG: electron transfer flavoprotein subunit beta/FixA family protein [Aigarchaeota archaeon]|nr:electron transfer flavoprotein subunit beta/FixA family protein [Aigarchaeota archaeon]MCX8193292.1 electron transfer flavoprotein subunit beta/FixA family protein [Nitrososphaeria archaeon]MDW7986511.1 electron transfer flavoprotein subunit beta/FixA family protein [Nitrososphaerota archaeon]